MIEQLAQYLEGFPNCYPHGLERMFPRILERLMQLWETPEAEKYLSELLLPSRSDRQGFPTEIVKELSDLQDAWRAVWQENQSSADPWGMEPTAAATALEARGLRPTGEDFHNCVKAGDIDLCQLFLFAKTPVDVRDERHWTPLMTTSFEGKEQLVKLFIKHRANINARDLAGYTPLHWAALNGYREIVHILIKNGAIVNAPSNSGITPLLQAAAQGHREVVGHLLESRADPNSSATDGSTPLHKAVANGHMEVVFHLLKAKASVFSAHDNGATPLELAERSKHPGIRRLVRAAAKAASA